MAPMYRSFQAPHHAALAFDTQTEEMFYESLEAVCSGAAGGGTVRLFAGGEALALVWRGGVTMMFAAGKLAGPGMALMERVGMEG